jgi:hypothetical protein
MINPDAAGALSLLDTFNTPNTLFDRIIDITFRTELNTNPGTAYKGLENTPLGQFLSSVGTSDEITVKSSDLGIKPDIAIGFKTLQGQMCYDCTVKIKNFKCKYNIRRFKSMDITAGYRDGPKLTFHSPIFSSYRESPNPDGVTVFEGVIVGSVDSLFTNRRIEIDIYKKNLTLREFVQGCIAGCRSPKDTGLEVDFANCGDVMDLPMTVKHYYYSAANGYALITWIAEQVNQVALANKKGNIITHIQGNKVIFGLVDPSKGNPVLTRETRILNLDKVTLAEFNGTTLTVKAPWHPYLQPLSLFYMAPNVYGGTNLPNVIPIEQLWQDPDNVYQVITEEVSFETNGGSNEMTIFAVPINPKAEMPVAAIADEEKMKALGKVTAESIVHVQIGDPEKTEQPTETSGKPRNWTDTVFDLVAMDYYVVQPGDTLHDVAGRFYANVQPYSVPYSQLPSDYNDMMKNWALHIGVASPTSGQKTPAVNPMFFWPLIVMATYKASQQQMKVQSATGSLSFPTTLEKDPDMIQPGWLLAIPRITGLEGHENLKELFCRMARVERDRWSNDEWMHLGRIYVYMGGTQPV